MAQMHSGTTVLLAMVLHTTRSTVKRNCSSVRPTIKQTGAIGTGRPEMGLTSPINPDRTQSSVALS